MYEKLMSSIWRICQKDSNSYPVMDKSGNSPKPISLSYINKGPHL